MTHSFLSQKRIIGVALIILGFLALLVSFFVGHAAAWIARMIALMAVTGGVQWVPFIERWLEMGPYRRSLVGSHV